MAEEQKKHKDTTFLWKVLLCATGGIALIFAGNLFLGKDTAKESTVKTVSAAEELRAYADTLETEIASLCATVAGAGKTTVAVTLSGGFTYEYATDYQSSGTNASEKYVTVGSGSSEEPVYLSVRPPGIAGIGVVCEGGGNAEVRRELISLLSAAYGVSTNKIYVTASGSSGIS